jgi:hypothetical protein
MNLNFKGVEETKDIVSTSPGTKDVFTIKKVVFESSKNKGTMYMGVTFNNKASEFTHSFFLSEKALPRVKSLVKHAVGKELDDEVSEAQLIAMLTGKQVALKVTAKFDDANGRAYADLPFGGFAKAPSLIDELVFTPKEEAENKRAIEIRSSGSSTKPEEPSTGAAPTSAPDDEVF